MATEPAKISDEISVTELARVAADLARASSSPETRKAYDRAYARFAAWCGQGGHSPLPTTPAIVGLYIAHLFSLKPARSIATIELAVAGIAYRNRMAGHALDRRHPAIAAVLAGCKRKRKQPPRQARPIVADELRRVLEVCRDDFAGKRNRALLLVAFYGALRGSELVGMKVEHLTESPAGYRLLIPSSKGDQEGEGQYIGLPRQSVAALCPVCAIKTWLQAADIESGPVFVRLDRRGRPEIYGNALTDRAWRMIVKELAKSAGFAPEDVAYMSGHSLRAGHITTGYLKEVDEAQLQKQARHRDPRTTRLYNRQATVFLANSAKGLMD
ncbi:MAG TPA: site-specific integrase [Terriglobia bacterium]|nr:site-specific integrase [Terriglobia bacterium]